MPRRSWPRSIRSTGRKFCVAFTFFRVQRAEVQFGVPMHDPKKPPTIRLCTDPLAFIMRPP